MCGVVGSVGWIYLSVSVAVVVSGTRWDARPEWVRVPYVNIMAGRVAVAPSSSVSVEGAVNLAGPLAKPKYFLVTDSG